MNGSVRWSVDLLTIVQLINFCTEIHGSHDPNDFGKPLTFQLVPPCG